MFQLAKPVFRRASSLFATNTNVASVAVRSLNVLAINGSSRKEKGLTHALLKPFLQGIKDADPSAQIEVFNTPEIKVKSCKSCFACWFRTPGAFGLPTTSSALHLLFYHVICIQTAVVAAFAFLCFGLVSSAKHSQLRSPVRPSPSLASSPMPN